MRTASIALGLLLVAILFYAYPLWLDFGKPMSVSGNSGLSESGLVQADANIADRLLFLWPRALDLLLQSPFFGAGYGSFNDIPHKLSGIPHLFMMNSSGNTAFDSGHAHNTYLHVLAENGVYGLGLLILFLKQLWETIQRFEPSVKMGLSVAFWVAIFASETEHRLFTPSQMLPFTLIVGMAIANRRWEIRNSPAQPWPGP